MNKIPNSLLNSYCWVQSTFTVPQACNQQIGLEVPFPCIDNTRGREIKIYAYYQWIGMVLFVQGLLFHLPYYLWKVWENGLIAAITSGLRVAVLSDQERTKKREIVVEYIYDHLGCHRAYAYKYFLCELICLLNLIGQIWCVNRFFDGQFLSYGLDVMSHNPAASQSGARSQPINNNKPPGLGQLQVQPQQVQPFLSSLSSQQFNPFDNNIKANPITDKSSAVRVTPTSNDLSTSINSSTQLSQQVPASSSSSTGNAMSHNNSKISNSIINLHIANNRQIAPIDPMSFVFPRITKCTYYDFGSSGDVQKHDAICLLPLNIINEKIYIALWFWFFTLAILTILVIVYRLFAISSVSVRCRGLVSRCKLSSESQLRLICASCDVGDWFLFYMVAENVDPIVMREIVASLADRLELRKEHDQAAKLAACLSHSNPNSDDLSSCQLLEAADGGDSIDDDHAHARAHMDSRVGHHGRDHEHDDEATTHSISGGQSCELEEEERGHREPNDGHLSSIGHSATNNRYHSTSRGFLSDSLVGDPEPGSSDTPSRPSLSRTVAQANECLPLVRKLKRGLYSTRLWAMELGPSDFRRQLLFGERPREPPETIQPVEPAEPSMSSLIRMNEPQQSSQTQAQPSAPRPRPRLSSSHHQERPASATFRLQVNGLPATFAHDNHQAHAHYQRQREQEARCAGHRLHGGHPSCGAPFIMERHHAIARQNARLDPLSRSHSGHTDSYSNNRSPCGDSFVMDMQTFRRRLSPSPISARAAPARHSHPSSHHQSISSMRNYDLEHSENGAPCDAAARRRRQ